MEHLLDKLMHLFGPFQIRFVLFAAYDISAVMLHTFLMVSVLFKEIYKCVQGMFFIFGPVQLVLDRFFFKSWEVQSRGGIWESFWVTLGLWILTFAVSLGIVWAVRKVRDNIAYYRNSV